MRCINCSKSPKSNCSTSSWIFYSEWTNPVGHPEGGRWLGACVTEGDGRDYSMLCFRQRQWLWTSRGWTVTRCVCGCGRRTWWATRRPTLCWCTSTRLLLSSRPYSINPSSSSIKRTWFVWKQLSGRNALTIIIFLRCMVYTECPCDFWRA